MDIYKSDKLGQIFRGIGYSITAPLEGFYRGGNGHNSPLPYDIMIVDDSFFENEPRGRYSDSSWGIAGAVINMSIGTLLAVSPWVITRSVRAVYDGPRALLNLIKYKDGEDDKDKGRSGAPKQRPDDELL